MMEVVEVEVGTTVAIDHQDVTAHLTSRTKNATTATKWDTFLASVLISKAKMEAAVEVAEEATEEVTVTNSLVEGMEVARDVHLPASDVEKKVTLPVTALKRTPDRQEIEKAEVVVAAAVAATTTVTAPQLVIINSAMAAPQHSLVVKKEAITDALEMTESMAAAVVVTEVNAAIITMAVVKTLVAVAAMRAEDMVEVVVAENTIETGHEIVSKPAATTKEVEMGATVVAAASHTEEAAPEVMLLISSHDLVHVTSVAKKVTFQENVLSKMLLEEDQEEEATVAQVAAVMEEMKIEVIEEEGEEVEEDMEEEKTEEIVAVAMVEVTIKPGKMDLMRTTQLVGIILVEVLEDLLAHTGSPIGEHEDRHKSR